MQILIINFKEQHEEKELTTFTCNACGKIGMSYVDKTKEIKPHYCSEHDPIIKREEIDE